MKKLFKYTLVILLVLSTFICNIRYIKADETVTKTASNLDSNYTTKITLLLNQSGSNETKTIDLVFLIDAFFIGDTVGDGFINEIYSLIETLNNNSNIDANIGVVGYGIGSIEFISFVKSTEITSKTDLVNRITTPAANSSFINDYKWGSNLQSGLLLAKSMMENSTSGASKSDQHMIILTDGGHYTYNNAYGATSNTLYYMNSSLILDMANMDSNGDVGNSNRESKMVKFYNETNDYEEAFKKLLAEGTSIEFMTAKGYNYAYHNADLVDKINAGEVAVYYPSDDINDLSVYPYTNLEMGTYSAAKTMIDLKDEGYNLYTIGFLYTHGYNASLEVTNRLLAYPTIGFLTWTHNVGQLYLHNAKTITDSEFESAFEDINQGFSSSSISSGSFLVDEMEQGNYSDGSTYDFDLVNDIDKISISVGGTPLDKEEISENVYGFGKDTSLAAGYKYILRYYPSGSSGVSDNESLKLEMNCTSTDDVTIEYQEVLQQSMRIAPYQSYQFDSGSSSSANNTSVLHNGTNLTNVIVPTLVINENNPATGDNIGFYVLTLILSSYTLSAIIVLKRK